jgi:hypothetical protein
MKVSNMLSSKGNKVANQFIIEGVDDSNNPFTIFQSYDSIIAKKWFNIGTGKETVYLDKRFWNYSVTTSKYRGNFLGETKKETEARIKSGEYKLVNLN